MIFGTKDSSRDETDLTPLLSWLTNADLNRKGKITSSQHRGQVRNYLRQMQQHNPLIPRIRASMMLTVITQVGVTLGVSALTSGAVTTMMAPGRWGYSRKASPTLDGRNTLGEDESRAVRPKLPNTDLKHNSIRSLKMLRISVRIACFFESL